ncbi:MAG: hypothetical protein JWM36_4784 [Hyphomicrobiales bacterium]|nr:hypothetical protein [Hyphomicrobiales bacterium]
MIKTVVITLFFLASGACTALAQNSNAGNARRDPGAPDQANSAPVPPSANANAPKAPALPEEPHGAGSVYEELKSTPNKKGD